MKAKTYFYSILCVFLLIACDKNGANSALAVHRGGPQGGDVAKQSQQQGIPNSGHQASTDITTSQEYQEIVLPLGQKIASLKEFSLPDETVSTATPSRMTDFFERIAKQKKWGLANLQISSNTGAAHNRQTGRTQLVPSEQRQQRPMVDDQQIQTQAQDMTVLYNSALVRITKDTILLDVNAYNSKDADVTFRGQMVLKALVAQMFINQHMKATDLLNEMANYDAKMRSDKAIQAAVKADQAEQINPVFESAALTDDEKTRAIPAFYQFLNQDLSAITADGLDAAAKANFIRGADFARPYVYSRTGTAAADSQ